MGSCSRRHFLLSICFLQLLFVIERQVFDFLGFMWAPILVNFFHIIFVIFGFFGAYQYRPKYLITYSLWNLLWIGWNVFLICFYLNTGILDRDSDLLNMGTGSVSWFEVNGYGCKPTYPTNITSEDPYRPVRPERVDGCVLEYHIVEIVHSSIQCALAILGFFGAICLGHTYLDEDDSFDFMGGDAKSPQHTAVHPMYVSYASLPTTNSATSTQLKQAIAAKPAPSATVITANNHNSSSTHCLNNTSVKLGVVLMSINGHSNRNANSSSNTNTLLSSSSSPSSTFTNCNGNGSDSIGNGIPPSALGGQIHEAHVPLHQQPLPHPLSRNSSFSKTRSGQLRKNSSSISVRYTDVIQQQQHDDELIIANEDDTFFIPKSSSCRNNFGISNPFNNVSSRYYRDGDGDPRADDDDDNSCLITGSSQQLSLSTPLKRIPSVTSSNAGIGTGNNTTTPTNENSSIAFERNFSHGLRHDFNAHQHRIGLKPHQSVQPLPPPVPPLPQLHLQQHFDGTENYRMPYQYITRSPNLNRIARRNNANLINNNNSNNNSSNSTRVMSPKYCDQIREQGGPPGYPGHENNNYPAPPPPPSVASVGGGYPVSVMHRAKSQDRLSHRSRRHHGGARGPYGAQQQRPRSFCSNNGVYPDYVIMEHPGS
ncbi:sodium/potassium-transporting ATPase subunit beta-1-interacting protein isoform X1 [Topomyia yanbarensis]|uniref:sodium/potassium-transporting ATPase subunit beta-1-interacting protein isoform X1 n=1 Tax=Topomyia yanbarensis TaxID=2498891 RepID=UPI00273CE302|nr:sodium/potassium-transporting ATPase subunit beta-1-interacting protein isoform X1 [Topomyia yanbarensis]